MTKTQHYQLNQWDPEDRILRVDFNSDNAAIDAALKTTANATAAEITNRQNADTKIRTDFAAADTAIRSEFAAADSKIRTDFASADTKIRSDFAAADTKIRTDFAAADTTLRNENMMVKLLSHTTTANSTQVNVSVSSINLTQYSEIIIFPQIKLDTTGKQVYFRVNSLSAGYYEGTSTASQFATFYPSAGYNTSYGSFFAKLFLYPGGENLVVWNCQNGQTLKLLASKLAPTAVTTLNFVAATGNIVSGSKITVYGVKA